MASQVSQLATLLQNMQMPDMPQVVKLPPPPEFTGALQPNQWLARAQRFADNMVIGPESMVVVGGYVYTGLQNGWVVEVRPTGAVRKILRMSTRMCGSTRSDEKTCGRPLGIRKDGNGYLIVADPYKGIYRVDPSNGRYAQLVDASLPVNGKPLVHINDLVVARDGTIFFTSSSAKHDRTNYFNIVLEGERTGRVLVYNPRAAAGNRIWELVTRLNFPNGLELSKDESYLLIAEGARAKIYRAWIGVNSPKRHTIETFASNLPGFVDNIRRTSRNTYWVGFFATRSKNSPSVLDRYGSQPQMRRTMMGLPQEQVLAQIPKYGLVVELNENGQIIRSLHDPAGVLFPSVSEVQEENGILYLGSSDRPFIGKLSLTQLPAPIQPGTGTGTSSGTVPATSEGSSGNTGGEGSTQNGLDINFPINSKYSKMLEMLKKVRANTSTMTRDRLRETVHILLQRLLESKVEALRAVERAKGLQLQLNALQGKSSPTPDTQTAAPGATTPAAPGATNTA